MWCASADIILCYLHYTTMKHTSGTSHFERSIKGATTRLGETEDRSRISVIEKTYFMKLGT